MALARHAKRRDANERLIVDTLRILGADVELLDRPVDLLVGYRGVTLLCEVKQPRKELGPQQRQFFSTWKGGRCHVLRTTEDARALLAELDHLGEGLIDAKPVPEPKVDAA